MSHPKFLARADLRLILFGGKGGVGKTSSAAAAALYLAERLGRSVLLVSTDPAHSLADVLALPTGGAGRALQRVEVVELDTKEDLAELRRKHGQELREIAERGTFLDREDIERFLSLSMPGLDELFAMLEISRWAERRPAGDTIIVDTAPTGHTLRLLAMPELLRSWVETLDALLAKHRYMRQVFSRGQHQLDELDSFLAELSGTIDRAESQLRDAARSRFVPVMIAEELSLRETGKLLEELDRLQIPADEIIVNKLSPASSCGACGAARADELRLLDRLGEPFRGRTLCAVPYHEEEVRGVDRLRRFWDGAQELRAGDTGPQPSAGASFPPRVQDAPPLPFAGLRLLLFAGKGGVGKTTLACATAVRLAREQRGEEILLFSTDPAHSLGDCLDLPVGPRPVRVADGLSALEIDADRELERLKQDYRRELDAFLRSVLHGLDLTFDRQVLERILDLSPPGLDEIMALTSAMTLMTEGSYGLLVLDAAPTGHLLRLLELPEIIDQWLKAFFELFLKYKNVLRLPSLSERLVATSRELHRFRRTLTDPRRAALYAVSILTEVALEETKDLIDSCARMQVDVPVLFLNLVTPTEVLGCASCAEHARAEDRVKRDYERATPGKRRPLVYRQEEPRGLSRLEELGRALYSAEGGSVLRAEEL